MVSYFSTVGIEVAALTSEQVAKNMKISTSVVVIFLILLIYPPTALSRQIIEEVIEEDAPTQRGVVLAPAEAGAVEWLAAPERCC